MAAVTMASLGVRVSASPLVVTPSPSSPSRGSSSVKLTGLRTSKGGAKTSRLYASQQEDFRETGKEAQNALQNAVERAQDSLSDVAESAGRGRQNVEDNLKETISGAQEGIQDTFGGVADRAEGARKGATKAGERTADDISDRTDDVTGRAKEGLEDARTRVEKTGGGIGEKVQEAWGNITGKGKSSAETLPDWTWSVLQYGASLVVAGALVLGPVPQAEARTFGENLIISGRIQAPSGPTETGKSGGAKNLAARELSRAEEKGSKGNAREGLRREGQLLSGQGDNPLDSARDLLTGVGEDAGRTAKGALNKARQSGPFSQNTPVLEVAGLFGSSEGEGKSQGNPGFLGKGRDAQNALQENASEAGDKIKGGADSIGESLQRNTSEALDKLKDKAVKTEREGPNILAADSGSGKAPADLGKAADNTDKGSYESGASLAQEESKFSTPGGGFQPDRLLKQEREGRIL